MRTQTDEDKPFRKPCDDIYDAADDVRHERYTLLIVWSGHMESVMVRCRLEI